MKYTAQLIKSIERTYDTKSFRFSRPPELEFKAGQYFYIIINKKLSKHISFSISPTEKGYIELTTKLTGSVFKNALNNLREGDSVDIVAPYGEFTYNHDFKKIAFLSGGIGITAIRSICKYLTDMKIDCGVTLLYGNNQEKDIVFQKDFEEMAAQNRLLKVVNVISNPELTWNGLKGFINKDILLQEISDYKDRVFYICGPPAMVLAMNKILEELEVEKQKIKLENFVGY
jgi:NAD(P)H-flavin reductase